MAEFEFTRKHISEICDELKITEDEVINWFHAKGHPDDNKLWSQKKLRQRLKLLENPAEKPKRHQDDKAKDLLEILKNNGFERQLNWLRGGSNQSSPPSAQPQTSNYDVSFPSDMTKKDVARLAGKNSFTGYYRLTRHKLSDAEPGLDYVVEYLEVYAKDDDIHFTLYAICSNSKKPITFNGTVRKLGSILLLAGKRTPDDMSDLSFKMLFIRDEGGPNVLRSRVRWGLVSTKTLLGAEQNPVSARVLFEKTHTARPKSAPKPAFKDHVYFQETYPGTYADPITLEQTVRGMVSNNIIENAAQMNRATRHVSPDLALSVSQATADEISPYLVENMGPLIEVE